MFVVDRHVAPVIDGDFFPKPLDELRKEAPKRNVLAVCMLNVQRLKRLKGGDKLRRTHVR